VEERFAHSDRAKRSFYTVPHNDISGAIRVNLIGREPEGRVRPEDLPAIHERLRTELKALRNLDTGEPVVRDVVRTSEMCHGEHIEDLPEFFVLWNREAPIERVGSDTIGEVVYLQRGNRTGDHQPESIFFAKGPGITPGRVDGVSVLDFAPTIARLLELKDSPDEGVSIDAIAGPA